MTINERSKEELIEAIEAVNSALAEKATKSTVLKVLANKGWCSAKSAGVEKTFLSALKVYGLASGKFAEIMGESSTGPATEPVKPTVTATTAEALPEPPVVAASVPAETAVPPVPQPSPKPSLPPEGPGDFTVVNLKAVSLMQTKNNHTDVRFIGSENGLSGNVGVSLLRSSCNLIEFAI